jgi:hypothetical protein
MLNKRFSVCNMKDEDPTGEKQTFSEWDFPYKRL